MGTFGNVCGASIKMCFCLQGQSVSEARLGDKCKTCRRSLSKLQVSGSMISSSRHNLSCSSLAGVWCSARLAPDEEVSHCIPCSIYIDALLLRRSVVYRSFYWSVCNAASFPNIIILCDHEALSHIKGSSRKKKTSPRGSCLLKDITLFNIIELQN